MTTDTFFTIGKTHTICQDYAEHGEDHVIVCDGCSTAPESNIGAILLSRAAKLFLRKFPFRDATHFTQSTLASAYAYARAMELHEDSLLATLLMAKVVDDDFKVVVSGDGVVAARYRGTSKWKVVEYTFPSGAPFYLRYTLDPAVEANYISRFGTSIRHTVNDLDLSSASNIESGEWIKGFSFLFEKKKENSLGPYYLTFSLAEYDAVAIMSDGAQSFLKTEVGQTSKQPVNMPLYKILSQLLHFKNYAGAFVQRRCKAAFKQFGIDNCCNSDDFSMGVIYHPEVDESHAE
jgi:hypothetical protein